MKKIYGLEWSGTNYTHKTFYTDKAKAEIEAENKNAKVHWLRRRMFNLKWYVRAFKLEE